VLFVGNQLNTDIRGGETFDIRTVWLSGPEYRSDEDVEIDELSPSYTIRTLSELPSLLREIQASPSK
jgi:FMN phosphatase YigB (HAD superfamily)